MQNVYIKDTSKLRVGAKAVAIIDLVCLGITLVVLPLTLFGHRKAKEAKSVLWIITPIFFIQIGVSVWAAVQLLKATQWRQELNEAYRRSRYWIYVSISYFFVVIIFCILGGNYIGAFIEAITRIMFMLIVLFFIKEVKEASTETQNQQQMTPKV